MAPFKRILGFRPALGMALVLLAATALPVVGIAVAQTPPAPTIQFLNPSGHSRMISDRDADGDGTYRLTAWVQNPPADPQVEFELQHGLFTTTLGPTQRMADDTWEFQWNIPSNINDGTYPLRAKLFTTGGQEVARDTEEVMIRQGSPVGDAAPRVEFVYPLNGGPAAAYIAPEGDDRANIVTNFLISGGTNFVRVFYSTTDPGTEPQWSSCGTESSGGARGTSGNTGAGVRCRLAANVHPASVTALAAVANSSSQTALPAADQSGDAVRVFPYMQVPTTVTVTPGPEVRQLETCAPFFAAHVLDQQSRPIAEANFDVHAVGPTDQLKFETNPGTASRNAANAPPNEGPHSEEPGWNCPEPLPALDPSPQGEHDRLGLPDRKHIESVATGATGSNDEGRWEFQLFSPDAGDTQVTVWADVANNDIYCGNDPAAHTSIRWVQNPNARDENDNPIHSPAPVQPEGVDADNCPAPQPTFGPSPTTSPATSSPSPSPTTTSTVTTSPTTSPGGDEVRSGPCAGHRQNTTTPREGGGGLVVVGTHGDDLLDGGEGDDVICGLGGNDTIRGLGGDDTLYGGRGDDTMSGGDGNDILVGGSGHDILRGGAGRDVLRGNTGNDTIRGGTGPDTLQGGRGHDILRGARGHDTLRGGRGHDELYGGPGNDILNGGPGNDQCIGGPGRNRIRNCN